MKRRNAESGTVRKRRKWILPIAIIGGVIAVIFIACVIILGVMAKKELGVSEGRYLAGRNGTDIVVMDGAPDGITDPKERERYMSPVVMSDRTNRDLFKNLETGDKILFVHGGIKESYPGGTGVYAVLKTENGGTENIPERVLNDMIAMGWVDPAINMDQGFPDWGLTLSVKDVTPTGLTLVCAKEGGNLTGEIMCGTEYSLIVSEGEAWKNVPTIPEEYGWDGMGYIIPEGKDTEFELSWEWLYGKLPAGTYRLTKDFMDFRKTADYDTAKYWVEFEIEE